METAQGRTMGPRERVPSAVVGLTVSSVPQVDLVHQSATFVSSPTRACPLLCFVSVWPAPDSSQTLHSFSIRISKPCRSLGFAASCSRRVVWCVGRGGNGRLSSLPFPQIFNVLFYGSHLFFFAYGWYSQVGITTYDRPAAATAQMRMSEYGTSSLWQQNADGGSDRLLTPNSPLLTP